jgi:hypothetical protein
MDTDLIETQGPASNYRSNRLRMDFWSQMSENVDAWDESNRSSMEDYYGLDNLLDEEKREILGGEYCNRPRTWQEQEMYMSVPEMESVRYWGQRAMQPGSIESLSGYASLEGQFWQDPWDQAVYEQQYRKWAQIQDRVAHMNDVENLWMR